MRHVAPVACGGHGLRLFLLQRDEKAFLSDWVAYHASIFGACSITVIDHKSTNPVVLDVLKYWETQGVRVIPWNDTYTFKDKAKVLSMNMHSSLNLDNSTEFLVPLDADEFIVGLTGNDTFSSDPLLIRGMFTNLPRDGVRYKFTPILSGFCRDRTNSTGRPAIDARHFTIKKAVCYSKSFYLRSSFIATDQGNHWGDTTADERCHEARKPSGMHCPDRAFCFHTTQLGILHFGTHVALTYQAYRDKMIRGYHEYMGDAINSDCSMSKVGGQHYCLFFREWKTKGDQHMETRFNKRADVPRCGSHTHRSTMAEVLQALEHKM